MDSTKMVYLVLAFLSIILWISTVRREFYRKMFCGFHFQLSRLKQIKTQLKACDSDEERTLYLRNQLLFVYDDLERRYKELLLATPQKNEKKKFWVVLKNLKLSSLLSLFCCCFLFLSSCDRKPTCRSAFSIGRDQTWFPLNLEEKRSNVNGFTNALFQELSTEIKTSLTIHELSWDQLFAKLDQNKVCGVLTSITPNAENQKKYYFSDPFLLLGPVLVLPSSSQYSALSQMKDAKVGVSRFDDSILILQRYPSLHIELFDNMPQALQKCAEGELDGVLVANLEAHSLVPTLFEDLLRIASPPLTNKGLRLIIKEEENLPLIKSFNAGLQSLKADSRYSALIEKFDVY